MLNYFLWYPIIWLSVFVLYSMRFSSLNQPLDNGLIAFILVTSIISLLLGYLYRRKFHFNIENYKMKRKSYIPIVIIIIATIVEFIYIKQVPFIEVAILKKAQYQDYNPIPIYHVILIAMASYYSIKYFCCYLVDKTSRIKSAIYIGVILIIFVLYNYRSFIIIFVFMAINILIEYLRSKHKIKKIYIPITIMIIIVGLYLFGIMGNIRQQQKWNDCKYIEEIGLYDNYPKYLPKEYMWAYSYITSPLANLNYNIKMHESNMNIIATIGELLPETISKRLTNKSSTKTLLIKSYFNVSTGWASVYNNGAYIGMIILFMYLCILGIIGIKMKIKGNSNVKFIIFCSFMTTVYTFMFFDNMISYVGTSIPFWISFISIIVGRKKIKYKLINN